MRNSLTRLRKIEAVDAPPSTSVAKPVASARPHVDEEDAKTSSRTSPLLVFFSGMGLGWPDRVQERTGSVSVH
jgi:hypothetical protein